MRETFTPGCHAGPSRPIEHLPSATQSKLRSTQILTSLPQIISELVQNSLDAEARHIDVGVDCEEWTCWVRDDGIGIDRTGFDLLAGSDMVGRYATSKAYSPASLDQVSTFGFRGEALASAADISCIEISSRTARSRESWSVILKGGESLYNGPSIRWRRESPGTVVSIRDAFYNLPIRRLSHPSAPRTIELVRKEIEAFSLVFPDVCFSLENIHRSKEAGPGKGRIMTVPKTASSLAAFRHLFGKALAEHVDEFDETSGEMRLQGFISLDGAQSKAYQFFYINRHLVSPCDLHRLIDVKFAASSFAKHAFEEEGETNQPRPSTRRSPRKSEKKPVYVLNLSIPPRHVDNCLEPAKAVVQLQNPEAATTFLTSVIEGFLIRHGFLVPNVPRQRTYPRPPIGTESGTASPRKRRRITRERNVEHECAPTRPQTDAFGCTRRGNLQSTVAPSALVVNPEYHSEHGDDPHGQSQTTWTDPDTGEVFIVDTRTGNSYPLHVRQDDDGQRQQRRRTLATVSTSRSGDKQSQYMPEWIKNALSTNEVYALPEPRIPAVALSSSFAGNTYECAPASSQGGPFAKKSGGAYSGYHKHHESWLDVGASQTRPGRFSKAALCTAQVMGQVDRKFVVCVVDADEDRDDNGEDGKGKGRALVLIDQHAADERIRVERFLKELCFGFLHHTASGQAHPEASQNYDDLTSGGPFRVRGLCPPIPILLTLHEATRLTGADVQAAFERWGVSFAGLDQLRFPDAGIYGDDVHAAGEDGQKGYMQVMVRSVPEVVSDKLLAGDELKNLVKGYLGKLEMEGPPVLSSTPPPTQGTGGEDQTQWQKAMRWCPRELLELVNSKACRGAIMFNDSLTLQQCTRLVRELADTAFPFQCAHGRPSLVPLAEIGVRSQGETGAASDVRSSDYNARPVNWDGFTTP